MPFKDVNVRRDYSRRYAYVYRTTEPYMSQYLARRYGITIADYQGAMKRQGGLCAICGSKPNGGMNNNRLTVDHDHTTGRFRGLLCDRCNRNLAFVESFLPKILSYLGFTTPEVVNARMDALAEIR